MRETKIVPLALLVSVAGCDPTFPECPTSHVAPPQPDYILVEYRSGRATAGEQPAEVKRAPSFAEARPKLKSAALHVPDICVEDAEGAAAALSLNEACRLWASELQTALLDDGFQVVPWATLSTVERTNHLTVPQAAAEVHADVVFMIDRLALDDLPARRADTSYQYFVADLQGHSLAGRSVDDATRTELEQFIDHASGPRSVGVTAALSAVIGGSAIVTPGGETIWEYDRTVTVPIGERIGMKFLFGRYGDGAWLAIDPTSSGGGGHPRTQTSEDLRTEEAFKWMAATRASHGMRPLAGERFDLVHRTAADFVRAFRSQP